MFNIQKRALTAALVEIGCGCFVPDLTSFTIPQCAGARWAQFYRNCRFSQTQRNIHFKNDFTVLLLDIPFSKKKSLNSQEYKKAPLSPIYDASPLQTKTIPKAVNPLFNLFVHRNDTSPLAACLSEPLVSCINAHLATQTAHR